MKILLSGDLHGTHDVTRISKRSLRKRGISPEEISYLIVLGDWGVIWNDDRSSLAEETYLKRWYDSMPWETLVLLGNHEGYDRIETLPWTERHGGQVRQASKRSFILRTGDIYTIGGLKFFIFGGAASVDKDHRIPHKSWWPQEIPNDHDLQRAIRSLEEIRGEIDYVLTHTCPTEMASYLVDQARWLSPKVSDPVCSMLTTLANFATRARQWYFGHFHLDEQWKNYRCLWNDLVVLETDDL
jgi:hypothetical protein